MNRIPNLIAPMEDELLYSYLFRLSKENGFDDYVQFHRLFLQTGSSEKTNSHRSDCLRYDSNYNLKPFFGCLAEYVWNLNIIDFFRSHTLYGYLSPLMNDYQQMAYVHFCFDLSRIHPAFSPAPSPSIKRLRYCPICQKEEIRDNGFYWFHRINQVPGINVCIKHGNPLAEKICKIGEEFMSEECQSVIVENVEEEIRYALFIEEFVKAGLNTDLLGIKRALSAKLELFKNTAGKVNAEELREYISRGHKQFKYSDNIYKKLFKPGIDNRRENKEHMLAILYLMFDNVADIKNNLPDCQDEKLTFEWFANEKGYELCSPYRKEIIELKHSECGEEYITTPYGFNSGWFCPECDECADDQDFAKRSISLTTNGEYELQGAFSGMNKKIRVMHNKCHKEMTLLAGSFFQRNCKCTCEYRIGYNEVKQRYEKSGEYKLSKFTTTQDPVEIYHIKCGHSFLTSYYYNRPVQCPFCKKDRIKDLHRKNMGVGYTEIGFANKVKSLVGDEYSVVGEFVSARKKVLIRHNICGETQSYYAFDFLRGRRCRKCSIKLTPEYVTSAVSAISGGLYKVTQIQRKGYYVIKDVKQNTEKKLYGMYIMQELLRPTPSEVLRVEKKYPFEYQDNKSFKEQIEAWVNDNENERNWFSIEDVALDVGCSKSYILRVFSEEKSKLKIRKLGQYLDALLGSGKNGQFRVG